MSSIPLGSPNIHIAFDQDFTSAEYNKRNNKILQAGLYDGGLLSVLGDILTVAPFVGEFRCTTGQQVRVETVADITCNLTQAISPTNPIVPTFDKPFVVANFSWNNIIGNYLDFAAKGSGEIYNNDVIFGKVNMTSGGVFIDISYAERSWGTFDQNANLYGNSLIAHGGKPTNTLVSGTVFTGDFDGPNKAVIFHDGTQHYLTVDGITTFNGRGGDVMPQLGDYPDVMIEDTTGITGTSGTVADALSYLKVYARKQAIIFG